MTWPPEEVLELVHDFFVVGHPKTAGSKRSFIPKKKDGSMVLRKDGQPMVVTNDDSGAPGKAWRSDVADAALAARQTDDPFAPEMGLLNGPLAVELTFYRQRPKGDYGTGRNAGVLKASAKRYPTTKPDTGKLARAVHDAFTSTLWTDDSIVVRDMVLKEYGDPEGVRVRVWTMPAEVGEALAAPDQEMLVA